MSRPALLLAPALLASAPSAAAAPPPPPIVATDAGAVRGERTADGRALFRGIPFAAPPVGARRWRPPAPPARWTGVRPATVSAPACAQLDDGWNGTFAAGSAEDCLYLEVGTPSLRPARPMPVLVWIHGGSNKAGGGAGAVDASIVGHGIVLVSIQYRLGPLGFLSHPALTAESPDHASGNYGLLDQQAALRWVQRNVAAFGGDPANVTIAGESAGAQDVGLQQLSPLAAGLFAKAIENSGTAAFGFPVRDLRTAEAIGEELAGLAGAPQASAARLRALPVAALLAAARRIRTPAGLPENGTVWLQTTIDGHVVREAPAATLARGGGQHVPLLIGSNTRELPFYGDIAVTRTAVMREFGAAAPPALAYYGLDRASPPEDDPVLGPVALRVATDLVFTCPATFVARTRAAAGVPVWQYQYGFPVGTEPVRHSSELKVIFGTAGQGGLPAIVPPLQAYWTNFMASGDPNGAGVPYWPRSAGGQGFLAFTPAGAAARTGPVVPLCASRPAA